MQEEYEAEILDERLETGVGADLVIIGKVDWREGSGGSNQLSADI